jgi:hypothetical protein
MSPKSARTKKKKQSTTETSSQTHVRATKHNINEHKKKHSKETSGQIHGSKVGAKSRIDQDSVCRKPVLARCHIFFYPALAVFSSTLR